MSVARLLGEDMPRGDSGLMTCRARARGGRQAMAHPRTRSWVGHHGVRERPLEMVSRQSEGDLALGTEVETEGTLGL